jgi:hypothetical protein
MFVNPPAGAALMYAERETDGKTETDRETDGKKETERERRKDGDR